MSELIPGWKQSYLEQQVGLNVLQSFLPRNIFTTAVFSLPKPLRAVPRCLTLAVPVFLAVKRKSNIDYLPNRGMGRRRMFTQWYENVN